MPYVRAWERLSEAVTFVMAAASCSQEEAKAAICQAIADGAIEIRGKLKRHTTRSITSKDVLAGTDLKIPPDIKPNELDWDQSRPLNPWPIRREIFGFSGLWELEWIELSSADVASFLCSAAERDQLDQRSSPKVGARSRRRPAHERALQVIDELFPQGVPEQADLPNTLLCRRVGDKLKKLGKLNVSDDTILRAAGRRHK
jgi:hypothetical protein